MKQLESKKGDDRKGFTKPDGSCIWLNEEQAKQVAKSFKLIHEAKLTKVGKILNRLGIKTQEIIPKNNSQE